MKIPVKSRSKVGFNMTPMIDVVFLLIIFFLVSSHLVRQESRPDLTLPVAPSADEDKEDNRTRVIVNVEQNGQLFVTGRAMTPAALEQLLKNVRSERGEDMEVRIRASRDAIYGNVEPVMLACTRAKIWNVTYAVYRKEQKR